MLESVMSSFYDELEKISTVSLSGLSPETVLTASQPQPMPTPGLDKARQILEKAELYKTAARRKQTGIQNPSLPQFQTLARPVQPGMSKTDKALSGGAHVVGGMGVGKLLAEYSHGFKGIEGVKPSPRVGALAMTAGGALGGARFVQKRLQERRMAKAAAATPGMALKASQQVAKVTRARNLGASLRKFTPTIGHRGTFPMP